MRFLKAFGHFWYDFLIGDDYKIAVAVIVAVVLIVALLRLDIVSDGVLAVVGGLVIAAAFTVSLVLDVRGSE